jgi:hypothetical protein
MPESGLFITIDKKETLDLYVHSGVYGELRSPEFKEVSNRSMHYAALADAASARKGDHVFFFNERSIIYGGQIEGSNKYGSFIINGPNSPLGRKANAEICWNECSRKMYKETEDFGVFTTSKNATKCQPYLIKFSDELGLKGYGIESDKLYAELSMRYNYPLPSNAIQRKSFCTITPGETQILLELLRNGQVMIDHPKDIVQLDNPLFYNPSMGISHLSQAKSKYHHDAMLIANPSLLPKNLHPRTAAICRKVPLTPFKPSNMDLADLCYYDDASLAEGTIPNTIIEMDWKITDSKKVVKLVKHIEWLQKVVPNEFKDISYNVFAPGFKNNVRGKIPKEYRSIIHLISYGL